MSAFHSHFNAKKSTRIGAGKIGGRGFQQSEKEKKKLKEQISFFGRSGKFRW